MKKLFVALLILVGATTNIPALRARAARPVGVLAVRMEPYAINAVNPIKVMIAGREEHVILAQLARDHKESKPFPGPRTFHRWLPAHVISARPGLDPWQNPYFLVRHNLQWWIGSAGPDGIRDTDDDILLLVDFDPR